MPIEIRELVIRATVDAPQAQTVPLEQLLARLKAQVLDECLTRIDERRERAGER